MIHIIISSLELKLKDYQQWLFLTRTKFSDLLFGLLAKVVDCLTRIRVRGSIWVIGMSGDLTCQPWEDSSFRRQLPPCVYWRWGVPSRSCRFLFGSNPCTGWWFNLRPFEGIRVRIFRVTWGSFLQDWRIWFSRIFSFDSGPFCRFAFGSRPWSRGLFCTWTWIFSFPGRRFDRLRVRWCSLIGSRTCWDCTCSRPGVPVGPKTKLNCKITSSTLSSYL